MIRKLRRQLAAIILLILLLAHAGQVLGMDRPSVLKAEVLAVNRAKVSQKVLVEAEAEVSRIFREFAVDIDWSDSLTDDPADPTPKFMIFIVVSHESLARSKNALGLTPRGTLDSPHRVAYIFADQIEKTSDMFIQKSSAITPTLLLAYAMAHEIGHLLLPDDNHSAFGIMRARLELRDFVLARGGRLRFSPGQEELMRQEVLRQTLDLRTRLARTWVPQM